MSARERLTQWANRVWGHLLIALVVTVPGVFSPFKQLIGSESADVWNHQSEVCVRTRTAYMSSACTRAR